MSTRCAEQVRCVDYTVVSSICNNKCFKHLVISQKLLAQSALVSTRCAEQVRCVDYTVVPSICKNKVLNILSYLKNYWVYRPECQRVVYLCTSIKPLSQLNPLLKKLVKNKHYWGLIERIQKWLQPECHNLL